MEAYERVTDEEKGFRVSLYPDMDASDPREWCNVGTMICWAGRYALGDSHLYASPDDFDREWNGTTADRCPECGNDGINPPLRPYDSVYPLGKDEDGCFCPWCSAAWEPGPGIGEGGIRLPLYLMDHSGLSMSTGSFGGPWDSGQVGWIYVTAADIAENWPGGGHEVDPDADPPAVAACLAGEVAVYSDYLEGNVFGFVCERRISYTKTHQDGTVENGAEWIVDQDGSLWDCFPSHDGTRYDPWSAVRDSIPEPFLSILPADPNRKGDADK